jgi:hypothetical protein
MESENKRTVEMYALDITRTLGSDQASGIISHQAPLGRLHGCIVGDIALLPLITTIAKKWKRKATIP